MDGRKTEKTENSENTEKDLISVKAGVKPKINTDVAKISICEFLNFLKTAYQVSSFG